MASNNNKRKILYLMKIFLEQTDEDHMMTANQLIEALKLYDVKAERKSIYNDIEVLQDYGLDIIQMKGKTPGYYLGSRRFELPELKLLVDVVQSSKFFSSKKSQELIKKLEELTSKHEAKLLERQVYIYNRLKSENETIYYSVDDLHDAIQYDKKIKFQYGSWDRNKNMNLRHNGKFYQVSPWATTWDNENYYLIAYEEESGEIRHYRVDKLRNVQILEEKRLGKEHFEEFNLPQFMKKTFGMFGGKDAIVSLQCENGLAGVILDRFGTDTMLIPVDEKHFRVNLLISVSSQFYGWVTGIGKGMKITGPENVKKEYQKYLHSILESYQ